jgi:hypothetical protein
MTKIGGNQLIARFFQNRACMACVESMAWYSVVQRRISQINRPVGSMGGTQGGSSH